jgi:hypothetical protein
MIGKKVKTIPHNKLCESYFNLNGVIIDYKEEQEFKRNREYNNDSIPTGRIFNLYLVKFNNVTDKEIAKQLWLYEDMFQIIE